ncbi:MAG: alpha/beta hydrolase [Burkholderiales bacterium]|nr:MAG: alpha/beta hydrolase [Burkholderiales bacterium]
MRMSRNTLAVTGRLEINMTSGRNAAPPGKVAPNEGVAGEWHPLVLANASQCTITHEGHSYALSLYVPSTPAPATGFPVIHVLDGDELFPSAAEAMRRLSRFPERTGIVPAIIVGITPHSDGDSRSRYRHYTFGPPADPASVPFGTPSGEGEALLAFITEALPSLIAQRAPIDAKRIALYGHSLSAYFTLNAAALRPGIFHVCAAVSPSLWWDEQRILNQSASLKATRIFLACGEKEAELNDPRRSHRAMLPRLKALEAALGKPAIRVFTNEDHGSVATVAIPEFLRFCMISDE